MFAQEAQFFTESRLLQRDVEIVLESVNNRNFVGSVIHPNGNIAEALLKEGFAKCVDWSLKCVTGGPEKYRQAQVRSTVLHLGLNDPYVWTCVNDLWKYVPYTVLIFTSLGFCQGEKSSPVEGLCRSQRPSDQRER